MEPDNVGAFHFETLLPAYEQQVSATKIGANVAWYSGSRANNVVLFINQLKGARPWDDPKDTGRIRYDENGYPLLVPDGFVVSQQLIRSKDVAGIAPHTGKFRLYGVGNGVFSLVSSSQGTLVDRQSTLRLPREMLNGVPHWYVDIDFELGKKDIAHLRMLLHQIDTADHPRDLSLVHHSHLAAFRAGEIFAPELLRDLEGYTTLRLMDWMRANRIEEQGHGWGKEGSDWTSPKPKQRYVGTGFYTFNNHAGGARNEGRFEVSVPIEHVVALANAVGADPWISLPVDIPDTRVTRLGEYVATNLSPDLVPRWEYGNELFNSAIGFEGYRYSLRMAHENFDGFNVDGPWGAVEWAAYRGPQLYDLLGTTFRQAGRKARFVAPGWAFSGSIKSEGSLTNGYLVRYFRAEQAQKQPNPPPLPLELVTDYSVAMYFGGTLADRRPDAAIARHILSTVDGAEAQARKLADWLLFAAGPGPVVTLTPENLQAPLRKVAWTPDLDIAATALIWADIEAGLNPLTNLGNVLRISDRALQYRGVHATQWRTVLEFQSTPPVNLAQMIETTQLVGYGGRLFGKVYPGLRSGLALSTAFRLDAHADYAHALGLEFAAYEGGSHVAYPVEGGSKLYATFNEGPQVARVLNRWLQIMNQKGLDDYVHFMSHSRTSGGDWWGVKAYVGQPLADSPKAQLFRNWRVVAGEGDTPVGFTGPLRRAVAVSALPNGALIVDQPISWAPSEGWRVLPGGNAQSVPGGKGQLRLTHPIPVRGSVKYRFRVSVETSDAEKARLRVVIRATGGEVSELVRWEGEVTNGEDLTFDLAGLREAHQRVSIAVQRVGRNRSGGITLRNAELVPLGG